MHRVGDSLVDAVTHIAVDKGADPVANHVYV
jgi:hypothetical protein